MTRPLALVATLATGCAAIGAPGGGTSVVIPLAGDGYLLTGASFHLTGPAELSVSADGDQPSIEVELEPGVYQVELEAGWQLARVLDDGTREVVDAVLAGSAVQEVAVVPGSTAAVRFEFLVIRQRLTCPEDLESSPRHVLSVGS